MTDAANEVELDGSERQGLEQSVHAVGLDRANPFGDLMSRVASGVLETATFPPVITVEALRSIAEEAEGFSPATDFSGQGLVKRLAALEGPDEDRLADKEVFAKINTFVSDVLDDPSARITIPASQDRILVERNGLTLPLANLGTGLHEVIILAAAATILSDVLICIEEPEVHLHPALQRRFVRYLDTTNNHYLIATHSAHMLDTTVASVSHVVLEGGRSRVSNVGDVASLAAVTADLGYRSSDILQANYVVWVEGPSDRVYLRRWLELVDDSLVEGIDYSIMFYGGRLLNHLTFEDESVQDFIQLRRLNRNVSVLIDSDRSKKGAKINATKQRVRKEFDSKETNGFAWVTQGRTIENYVAAPVLRSAVSDVRPGDSITFAGAQYAEPLPTRNSKKFDKVAIAHAAAQRTTSLAGAPWDLQVQARRLADFIRDANS